MAHNNTTRAAHRSRPATIAAAASRVVLHLVPDRVTRNAAGLALNTFFHGPRRDGRLAFLERRRLRLRITDLDVDRALTLRHGRLEILAAGESGDVTITGSQRQFLALGLRRGDADTFFFRRELAVTGDTELGLAAKNFLDSLEPEDRPLPLRALPRGVVRPLRRMAEWLLA